MARAAALKLVGEEAGLSPDPDATDDVMFLSSLIRRASVAPPPK